MSRVGTDVHHALHARAECEELNVALEQQETSFHDVARAWFGLHDAHPLPNDVRKEYLRLYRALFKQFSDARGSIESSYFPEHLPVAAALTDIEYAARLPAGARGDTLHKPAGKLRQRLWRRVTRQETPAERAWRLWHSRASAAAIHLEPVLGEPDDWTSKHLLSACLTLHYKALEFLSSKHRRVCLRRIFMIISWVLGTLDYREAERRRGGTNGKRPPDRVRLDDREATYLWREFGRAEQYYREHADRRAQLRYTGGMLIGVLLVAGLLPAILFVHGSPTRSRFLVTLIAGALGATMSVLMRLTRGTLVLEREAETRTMLVVGVARPFIGAVFGALVYVLIAGGLLTLSVTTPSGSDPLLSYAGLAFLAGFSERVAQTTVASGTRALMPDGDGDGAAVARRSRRQRRAAYERMAEAPDTAPPAAHPNGGRGQGEA